MQCKRNQLSHPMDIKKTKTKSVDEKIYHKYKSNCKKFNRYMYLQGISEKENVKTKSFLLDKVWVSFCHLTLETTGLALTIHLSCLDDPRRMFRGEGSRVMRGLSVHKED